MNFPLRTVLYLLQLHFTISIILYYLELPSIVFGQSYTLQCPP